MAALRIVIVALMFFFLSAGCSENEKSKTDSGSEMLEEYKKLNEQKKEKEKLQKEIEELKQQKVILSDQLKDSVNIISAKSNKSDSVKTQK